MSLPDALKIGLSFLSLYKKSPVFNEVIKRIENDHAHKAAMIERLNTIIKVSAAKR